MGGKKENLFSLSFLVLTLRVQIRNLAGFLHRKRNSGNKHYLLTAISTASDSSSHSYSTVLIVLTIIVSTPYLSRRYHFWKLCVARVTTFLAALHLQLK